MARDRAEKLLDERLRRVEVERDEAFAEAVSIRDELDELSDNLRAGKITPARYHARTQQLEARERKVRATLQRFESSLEELGEMEDDPVGAYERLADRMPTPYRIDFSW